MKKAICLILFIIITASLSLSFMNNTAAIEEIDTQDKFQIISDNVAEKKLEEIMAENQRIQKAIDEELMEQALDESEPEVVEEEVFELELLYEADYFKHRGVLNYNDLRWTWYSQKVLYGLLDVPGRHIDENGYICDENDYIILASCDYEKGTIIETPLGKYGCVYDYCRVPGTIDVYVNW